MRGRWGRVAVSGASMLPTLRPGDWLVVRWSPPNGGQDDVSPGALVVLERPDRPGLLVVKRAVRRESGGWWVLGDNAAGSDDSRVFGVVPDRLVRGRVVARYWPWPPVRLR